MPTLSGPNPLSVGEFNAAAGNSGTGAAVNGVSALGAALAGNPAQLAQSRYLGAETAHAQAQTAGVQQQQADLAQATKLLQDPTALTNPQTAQQVGALLVKYPEQGKALSQILSTAMAGSAAAGGPVPQATADRFSAATGVAPMSSTATGQGIDNTNKVQVANIGANATLGSAGIAAGAARYGADRTYAASTENARGVQTGLDNRTLVQTGDANSDAPPTYTPAVQAAGKPAYDSVLANTLAAPGAKPINVATPGGGTNVMTTKAAIATGATPRMANPTEAQGALVQDATMPTPGPGGAPVPQTPDGKAIRDATLATLSGRAAPGTTTPVQVGEADNLITARLKAMQPTTFSSNVPSPELLNAIRLQSAWLFDNDPTLRGNTQAAVTQAIMNVTGKNGEGIGTDMHLPIVGRSGPSQIVLKDGANIQWPKGMPVPQQYAPAPSPLAQQLAPGGGRPPAAAPVPPRPAVPVPGASPLAAQMSGQPTGAPAPQMAPPPAAAPPAPQPAPVAGPPPQALAALREGTPTTFANGQTWTLQGGRPVRVK